MMSDTSINHLIHLQYLVLLDPHVPMAPLVLTSTNGARVNVKIAFVPFMAEDRTEMVWWPAIIYSTYAHAMDCRRETIPFAINEIMVHKLLREHLRNYGPESSGPPTSATIAQLLGFEHKWLEFTQHESLYTYVPTALSQKVPSRYVHTFWLGMEQLKGLLGCEETDRTRIDRVLKDTTFDDAEVPQQDQPQEQQHISSLKPAISQPTRDLGRKNQPPSSSPREKLLHPPNMFRPPQKEP